MQSTRRGIEVAVVDLEDGDHQRIMGALTFLGQSPYLVSTAGELAEAPLAILSHPGPLPHVLNQLKKQRLAAAMEARLEAQLPTLALGTAFHALCEGWSIGNEGGPCLGLLPGIVRPLPSQDPLGRPLRSPHIGYNTVTPTNADGLLSEEGLFYFAHSSVVDVGQSWDEVQAETQHALIFPSVIARDALFGVQFRPELSGEVGRKMLSSFCNYRPNART